MTYREHCGDPGGSLGKDLELSLGHTGFQEPLRHLGGGTQKEVGFMTNGSRVQKLRVTKR